MQSMPRPNTGNPAGFERSGSVRVKSGLQDTLSGTQKSRNALSRTQLMSATQKSEKQMNLNKAYTNAVPVTNVYHKIRPSALVIIDDKTPLIQLTVNRRGKIQGNLNEAKSKINQI